MATRDYSGGEEAAPIPQRAVRGTRIRWDGALKAVGIGLAALIAVIALPRMLGGEPPPPPEDVGLVAPPPPAPEPPALPAPPPPATDAKPRREPRQARERGSKRRWGENRAGKGNRKGDRDGGRPSPEPTTGAAAVSPAAWTYAPAAPSRENFGFEP